MLTGTLDDFTLPEMFRFLASCRKTGCIEVRRDAGEGRVFLRDGSIYFGESSATRAPESGEQTPDSLTRQIEGSFFDLLRWEGGDFSFSPDIVVDLQPTVEVDVEALITETAQKLDELGVIAAKIPSERSIPAMAPNPPADSAQINITPDEWRVLVLVSGNRSVADIASEVGLDPFTVMRTLYGLATTGLIEVVGESESSPPETYVPEPSAEISRAFAEELPPAEEVAEQLDAEFPPFSPEPEVAANGSIEAEVTHLEPDASADPLLQGEDAEFGLPAAELEQDEEDFEVTDDSDYQPEPVDAFDPSTEEELAAAAVSDLEGALSAIEETIPIEETTNETEAVVDRLAAVKELADLFGASDVEGAEYAGGPPYPPEIEAQREQEREQAEAAPVPDTRRRVEDDEEITRGLISRLIDGVKGL